MNRKKYWINRSNRFFHFADDGSSLSEACSTPIIGAGSRAGSSHTVIDVDDMDSGLHSGHLATRASLSSLGVNIRKNCSFMRYMVVFIRVPLPSVLIICSLIETRMSRRLDNE